MHVAASAALRLADGAAALDWLGDVSSNVVANAVAALVGALSVWVWRRTANRRIWSLSDERTVVLYVAEDAREVVTKGRSADDPPSLSEDEVRYVRSATGIGQVRALAALAPSLRAAYRRLDLGVVRMAGEGVAGDQQCDLISLGGAKNSQKATGAILRELSDRYVLASPSRDDWLTWVADDGSERRYHAQGATTERYADGSLIREDEIRCDYGLVVKAPNPWNPRATVIVLAGASTHGTAAAASFFVSQRRWRRPKYFTALVRVGVAGGHCGKPECVKLRALRRRRADA